MDEKVATRALDDCYDQIVKLTTSLEQLGSQDSISEAEGSQALNDVKKVFRAKDMLVSCLSSKEEGTKEKAKSLKDAIDALQGTMDMHYYKHDVLKQLFTSAWTTQVLEMPIKGFEFEVLDSLRAIEIEGGHAHRDHGWRICPCLNEKKQAFIQQHVNIAAIPSNSNNEPQRQRQHYMIVR